MKRFCSLLFIAGMALMVAVFALPGMALAEDPTFAGALAGILSQVVFPLVAAVVMGLVGWAVTWAAKKWKLGFLLESEEYLQRLAFTAVSFVEERAAKMVKESGVSLPGGDKLNMAVARIMAQSPEISQDRAEELVESILARLKGAGATGDKVL
jgi:hypothetical protein